MPPGCVLRDVMRMSWITSLVAGLVPLLFLPGRVTADSIVVFNEIHYHPAGSEPTREWVELYNQNVVDVDLSGWRLSNGITFTFPPGSVIGAGGYVVVAISPQTLLPLVGTGKVYGPFSGRLSNSGETLELRDLSNKLMDSVRYGVDGRWPVAPDGGGVSLAKRSPGLASAPPDNWTASEHPDGTPGTVNFSSAVKTGPAEEVLGLAYEWRFRDDGSDLGTAWRGASFDDSAWGSGRGLFYLGSGPLPAPGNTPLASGPNTYYFRTAFDVAGNPGQSAWLLRGVIDDGAVVYLNGVETARIH
ncbi:MAG: lamin tail domain-containing protein, partial [Verrucomicrobia bacterium]|nr:lamin tail domain-containing protein [Verrucomicrobiota bacterium]